MTTHEIELRGYAAYCRDARNVLHLGTAGSYGLEQLHITADDSWAGLTITATFTVAGRSFEMLVDGQTGIADVPKEATAPTAEPDAPRQVVFAGSNDGALRISCGLPYFVAATGPATGQSSAGATPSLAEQLLAQYRQSIAAAEAAQKAAEAAQENAAAAKTAADEAAASAETAADDASTAAQQASEAAAEAASAAASSARAAAESAGVALAAANEADAAALDLEAALEKLENASGTSIEPPHRLLYRGQYLGDSVTQEQAAAIADGSFTDIYLGDYWIINDVRYDVADFDYWLNKGDVAFTAHHLVMLPHEGILTSVSMNSTTSGSKDYVNSEMYTTNLPEAIEIISAAFGDYLLTHRVYLVDEVTNGYPAGGGWYDSQADLMSEIMVYGTNILAPASFTSMAWNKTVDRQQLALFAVVPGHLERLTSAFWLRDAANGGFARVTTGGLADYATMNRLCDCRPVFAIGVSE